MKVAAATPDQVSIYLNIFNIIRKQYSGKEANDFFFRILLR